ncbi:MAG: hypothetical protein KF900_10560 [Bacteroidetes bacterium]|nr:hypothetical protein [Bacteroidota bacterium]
MQTTYSLRVSELNNDFLESLKALFKNKKKVVTVVVSDEEDVNENLVFKQTAQKQFLAGYADSDSVYDTD